MTTLSSHEILIMFLAVAVLVGIARAFGELVEKFGQPAVVGELLAGIILGRSILGELSPALTGEFFPSTGPNATVLDGLAALSVAMLLLLAGLEIELSYVFRQIRGALLTSLLGFSLPFTVGFAAAWWLTSLLVPAPGVERLVFALFFGTALAITGLPVVAKTLLDLNLFKSKLGLLVMTCAMILDVVGFALFSVVMGIASTDGSSHGHVGWIVGLTAAFLLLMLTVGRWVLDPVLKWGHAHLKRPVGVLGIVLTVGLLSAAATEWIGIHAIFGTFLAGIALGDSKHLSDTSRETIRQIVMGFFAPFYFAQLGLRIDFAGNFNVPLVLTVMALGSLTKVAGNGLGSYWGGLSKREALAVGFGLNAGGIMQIVFAILAFQKGVIREDLLVAVVFMSVVTSIVSGPMMARLVREKHPRRETVAAEVVPATASQAEPAPGTVAAITSDGPLPAREPFINIDR